MRDNQFFSYRRTKLFTNDGCLWRAIWTNKITINKMDIVHELLVHGWCKITIGKEAENNKLNSEK